MFCGFLDVQLSLSIPRGSVPRPLWMMKSMSCRLTRATDTNGTLSRSYTGSFWRLQRPPYVVSQNANPQNATQSILTAILFFTKTWKIPLKCSSQLSDDCRPQSLRHDWNKVPVASGAGSSIGPAAGRNPQFVKTVGAESADKQTGPK